MMPMQLPKWLSGFIGWSVPWSSINGSRKLTHATGYYIAWWRISIRIVSKRRQRPLNGLDKCNNYDPSRTLGKPDINPYLPNVIFTFSNVMHALIMVQYASGITIIFSEKKGTRTEISSEIILMVKLLHQPIHQACRPNGHSDSLCQGCSGNSKITTRFGAR